MSNALGRKGPVVLCVLDGWGYRPEREGNAIALARAPNWQALWGRHPRTLLNASELAVGLPEGQMGNSEVGHLNLGAGRVVPQDLVRISQTIQNGEFYQIPALVDLCSQLRQQGIEEISEVKQVILESNGHFSVITKDSGKQASNKKSK